MLIYAYVDHLKNPSKMQQEAPGTFRDLQAVGITPQDYAEILKADPLATCEPPPTSVAKPAPNAQGGPPVPCFMREPAEPRFVDALTSLPYEPPPAAGDPVPLQQYSIDTSNITTIKHSEQDVFKVGFSAEQGFSFFGLFKASLKEEDALTWTDTNETAKSTGTEQKMALTMGGPAFGYTGPINIAVYYDTVYKTFAFRLFELPSATLHGVVMNSVGKPIAGKEIIAIVGGVHYRTFTNAKGEYHFPCTFTGPVDLQVGAVMKRLPQIEPEKSIDFRLEGV